MTGSHPIQPALSSITRSELAPAAEGRTRMAKAMSITYCRRGDHADHSNISETDGPYA